LVAKIIRIRDVEFFQQVTKEFDIHKDLNHRNIVRVEELIANELDEKAFIIMEYCKGISL